MQPQNTPPADPRYSFILNGQKPKNRFGLTPFHLKGDVSHISLISLVIVVLILFSIVIFGGGGGNTKPYTDLVARAQEINRVSGLVAQQNNIDPAVLSLAATVQAAMNSQEQQFAAYLSSLHKKIVPTKETAYLNRSTDSSLQSAAQNGNLAGFYKDYVRSNLGAYQSAMQTDYKKALAKAKPIITEAFNGNKVILQTL